MSNSNHCILCVDDEPLILHSLQRLLRREGYDVITASSGPEALSILEINQVQLIMTDQRMPNMSGIELLAEVKERYPDTIRIVLSGYTEVDAITEAINKGHVYKFFLKPWNDQSLRLEIKLALEQFDLIQANRSLHEKVLEQNDELKTINENLEDLVQERTKEIEIQNHALQISQAILQDLPLPIIGVSAEGTIVVANYQSQTLIHEGMGVHIGSDIRDCFSQDIAQCVKTVLKTGKHMSVFEKNGDHHFKIDVIPLSGPFHGQGVILTVHGNGVPVPTSCG